MPNSFQDCHLRPLGHPSFGAGRAPVAGGGSGIRTHERGNPLRHFECRALGRTMRSLRVRLPSLTGIRIACRVTPAGPELTWDGQMKGLRLCCREGRQPGASGFSNQLRASDDVASDR